MVKTAIKLVAIVGSLSVLTTASATGAPSAPKPGAPSVAQPVATCQSGYVALTYDDGPSPWTSSVSTALKRSGLKATFFLVGSHVLATPAPARQLVADGQSIGNHTYEHLNLTTLPKDSVDWQIRGTNEAILNTTRVWPTLFRPPYGATNWDIRGIAEWRGQTEVIWTLDTNDWQGKTASEINAVVASAKSGDVILMHDDAQSDVDAVPLIAATLRRKGLCAGNIVRSTVPVQAWDGLTYNAAVVR